MATTPLQRLEYAKELLATAKSEISLRNAAREAYYAAFQTAEPIAEKIPLPSPPQGGSHERVIATFQRASAVSAGIGRHMEARGLGHRLNQLRSTRTLADYSLDNAFPRNIAEQAIIDSDALIQDLGIFGAKLK